MSREQAFYGMGGTNGGGDTTELCHANHRERDTPYSGDRNSMGTLGVIVGTAFLTLAAIAAFLRMLFRELEKADDYDGFE